jgi:hypothetical protein
MAWEDYYPDSANLEVPHQSVELDGEATEALVAAPSGNVGAIPNGTYSEIRAIGIRVDFVDPGLQHGVLTITGNGVAPFPVIEGQEIVLPGPITVANLAVTLTTPGLVVSVTGKHV